MDKNCYVEPIYKNPASAVELQNADSTLLAVWGMGCGNCATRVHNSLLAVDGVYGVDVYLNMALAEVRYNSQKVSEKMLVEAVARAGSDGRHEYHAQIIVAD